MKFTMTVDMDNAAFDHVDELTRILECVADEVADSGIIGGTVRDINGNTVGSYKIEGERDG